MRRRAWLLALGLVSLALPTKAIANPSAKLVFVRGDGAERCPDEPELRRAVAARLGYDPFFPAATKTVVTEVDRTEQGFRGKLRIVADGKVVGQRELVTRGDDCHQLLLALALAVSIALDDLDAIEPAPTTPDEPVPSEPAPPPAVSPPSPPRAARPVPPSARPRPPSLLGSVSLGPTLALGTAPAPAFGASLASEIRIGWFGARLDARAELPASTELQPRGTVSTQTFGATLSGCMHPAIVFFCLGAGGGALLSRSSGITTPATDAAGLLLLAARAGVAIPLGTRFYFEPSLEVGLTPIRHTVEVNRSPAYTTALGWGLLAAHIGVHFP